MYKMSPTAWSVDYMNQVLVASKLMRVQSPFLAGHYLPHYSHRTHSLSHSDDKAVQLSAPLIEVNVIRTACVNYHPEAEGYLHVCAGDRIQLLKDELYDCDQGNLYSRYVYGCIEFKPSFRGWFPCEILYDVEAQFKRRNASVI